MFNNELSSWRNIILKDNIITNTILDTYLLDLGFTFFNNCELIDYLESDLKNSLKDINKYSDIEFYYTNFSGFKNGCLVLNRFVNEKRYILIVFNTMVFLIYKKKGSNKLNEELLIKRLSFTNLNECNIIIFDKKISVFLNEMIVNSNK